VIGTGTTVEANTFCINPEESERNKKNRVHAVYCQPRQVIPSLREVLLQELILGIDPATDTLDLHRYNKWITANIARVAEKNGRSGFQLAEFNDFFNGLLRDVFNILDMDGDGSVELKPPVEEPSITIEPFNMVLSLVFRLFDINNDNILSVTDDIMDLMVKINLNDRIGEEERRLDRNNDGIWTVGELVGQDPITWPYPLYELYSRIDVNQDSAVDLTLEAQPFLERAFALFDVNNNGLVTVKEVLTVLNRTRSVPEDRMVAIQIVLEKYSTLLEFMVRETITAADTDGDMKTTFDEILQFDDWNFIDKTLVPAVAYIGYPSTTGPMGTVIGMDIRRDHRRHPHEIEQAAIGFGFRVLLGLLEEM